MKNQTVLLFCILFINCIFAQEKVSTYPFKIEKNATFFEIVDSKSKELLLFLNDVKGTKLYKTNNKFEVIDSLSIQKFSEKSHNKYLGHVKKGNNYYLYWQNAKRDSILYQKISFDTKQIQNNSIAIVNGKKEIFLESVEVGLKFYVITIPKNGNSLVFHTFKEGEYEKKVISFEDKDFYYAEELTGNSIWDVFNDGGVSVQKFNNDAPASLPLTKNKKKLYLENDKEIVFTFDNGAFYTQILRINTDDFTYTLNDFSKTTERPTDGSIELSSTNSFLCNNHLFQIEANREFSLIQVKNMNNEQLKLYKIEKDTEIDFLNSDIIQENMSVNNKKILGKSDQLVRKLYNYNLGITSEYKNNNYNITIGGFSEVQNNNNAMMYGAMFGLTGALLAVALTPSYTMQNVNSYQNRVVVYTKSQLDENFNHKPGLISESAFDKLRLFMNLNSSLNNQMVFKFDQTTYFGGYDKKSKLFSFYKFND